MATVAELRMDVDSRPVKTAGRDLDQLSQKAERTERSARKLGEGARRAGRGLDDYARQAKDSARQTSAFESALGRTIGRVAGFTAGILSARAAIGAFGAGLKAADDFRALDNRIKLVTKSAEEFAQVQTGLIDISRRTFSSIEGTVQAYQRMAGATDRLGISQERLLGVAETVNKAVALSGATSQAAEASLIQFGQALSNNFQASAQEINSLNEQVFALSDAIARGITKVTGVEVFRSDLKRLAEEGKLSSELVIAALEAVKEETDKTFGDLDRTFAQVLQRVKTNAQVLSKEAFGPLLQVKIDFYTKFAEALEDPRTIAAAQKFGATLVDIARAFEKNAAAIGKAAQGIAAAIAVFASASLIRSLATLPGLITAVTTAFYALSSAILLNPIGALVAGLAVAVGAIVTFRDEITRTLTPFESFKELADATGASLKKFTQSRGLFKVDVDTKNIESINARIEEIFQRRAYLDRLLNSAEVKPNLTQEIEIRSELGSLKKEARELFELLEADAKSTNGFTAAVKELGDDGEDALEKLRKAFAGSAEEADKLRLAAEKAKRALASDVSSTFFDFKIGEGLAQFQGLDLGGFSQAGRNSIFSDFERTIDDLTRAIESDEGLSAEARAQQLAGLSDTYDQFLDEYNTANEEHVRKFKDAVQSVTAGFLDDLLFNGGRGLGDFFRSAIRDVGRAAIIDPISKAFSGEGSIFGNLKSSFKTLTDNFGKAGSQIAGSISKSLAGAGQALGAALGGALAGFGLGNGLGDLFGLSKGSTGRRTLTGAATGAGIGFTVAGPLGAAVGAIAGALSGAISGLFGRKTATGTVDLASGSIFGTKDSKKEGGARNERRDTILQAVSQVAAQFAEALGTTVSRGISLQVEAGKKSITTTLRDASGRVLGSSTSGKDDVEGAFESALKLVIDKAFSGGNQTLKDFASSALAAGRSIDEVISVLQVLNDVTKSGQKALSDYALAAAKAGRSSDQIVQGVQALANVYALTEKPLSEIAQQLKNIDDAVEPVIADLKSLGRSFAEIASIGDAAAKALGENFIQGIRDLNIDLQNSVFGNFNKLLQEIRQREEDAALLLQRGAISSQQFGFVQSTGGLQVSKFFEGLSDDDKESLADFLGLLRTASGDIAVARVKLEEQFDYLIDNVEETARGFEEAAQNFERLAQNLSQTADAIRTEFSGLTPRDNVVTLQGRVAELLSQARDETATTQSRQSALEALPATVTQLVDKARQAFGGTEQFARIRDFGLSALDSSATLADELAKFNYAQAEAAREDVRLLTDIRELLNDDRQLPTLQSILDEGRLTNQLIAQQLQAFLNLMSTAGSNLNQITAEELQQAAAAYLSQQTAAIASQTTSPSTTTPVTGSTTIADVQVAQAIVDLSASTDRNSTAIVSMSNDIDDLTAEIRRLLVKLAA